MRCCFARPALPFVQAVPQNASAIVNLPIADIAPTHVKNAQKNVVT